jgi:hypothetical protein
MPRVVKALDALLRGLIDYAGLFPPAAHDMAGTVERYARYRLGPDAAALGRLVVPATRLVEWEQAVAALPAEARGNSPWRLTVLVGVPPAQDLATVAAFTQRASAGRDLRARVDSIEVNVASADDVRRVASEAPAGLEVFYECQPGVGVRALADAIRVVGGGAKIRTGGLVPEAIAAPGTVAEFIAGCVSASVPFKATAGLHHPVRSMQPLAYQPDAPRAVTNGFLNVFVAAALAYACDLDARGVLPIIEETSPRAFAFTDSHLAWRGLSAGVDQVHRARALARGFGSCSFDEPIADLESLGDYL